MGGNSEMMLTGLTQSYFVIAVDIQYLTPTFEMNCNKSSSASNTNAGAGYLLSILEKNYKFPF
jgi:hypothetical protein